MAGSIATAYVQVIPSMQGVKGKLEKGFGDEGKSSGGLFGSNLVKSAMGVIASAQIGKTLWKTLNAGAELEQNLGGVQAVYGNFASSITASAKQAYSEMGLSASEYMATANKMGSLFQGSGLQQQRAMELTTKAMQRAADVASVMGVETSWAMESIAGAAKGNFTMMDNLGVAMNATTLEAYALEKGINFKWNTASQAQKAELAMEMFFDRTSQYAGNFKREATETFSGAFESMKASAKNVLTNLSLGEDIKPSLKTLVQTTKVFLEGNFIPAVKNVVFAIPTVIQELGGSIADAILGVFGTDLQTVISELETIFAPLKEALSGLFSTVSETVRPLVDAFREYVSSGKAMADVTSTIRTILEGLVSVLSTVVNWISQFITWLNSGSTGAQVFKAVVIGIATAFASWKIIESTIMLVAKLAFRFFSVINTLKGLGNALNAAKLAITAIGGPATVIIAAIAALAAGFIYLWNTCEGFRQFFISMGQAIVSAWNATVAWIGQAAMSVVGFFTNTIPQAFQSMVTGFQSAVSQFVTLLNQTIANLASWAISMGQKAVEAAAGFVNSLVNGLASLPSTMYQIGSSIVSGIWNGISAGWGWLTSQVQSLAQRLFAAAKAALGINSPSKVFRDGVGRWIPAGIAAGIRDYSGLVTSAMDDLTAKAQADFNAALRVNTTRGGAGDWQNTQSSRVVNFVQNVYAQAQTAAELAQETRYQAEMKVLLGV